MPCSKRKLQPDQLDRAAGVVFGTAAGEVLTNTDDSAWGQGTALGVPLLEALGAGLSLSSTSTHGRVVRRWIAWALAADSSHGDPAAPSTALQVLTRLATRDWEDDSDDAVASACLHTARAFATRRSKQGDAAPIDCGALLLSGILALGFLHDADDAPHLADAARATAALTDPDPETGETCVLWAAMIRQHVLTGTGSIEAGLQFLEPQRAAKWLCVLQGAGISEGVEAPGVPILHTAIPDTNSCAASMVAACMNVTGTSRSFKGYLDEALNMKGKYYTAPTVALTGTLAGATQGAKCIPSDWRAGLHGWPGLVDDGLQRLITKAIEATASTTTTLPAPAKDVHALPSFDTPAYDDSPADDGDTPPYRVVRGRSVTAIPDAPRARPVPPNPDAPLPTLPLPALLSTVPPLQSNPL